MEAGHPISYQALARGTPVFTCDGEQIGTVRKVLAVPEKDIFDGLVLATPRGRRFVDAPEVASIYERRVELTIDSAEAARLPKPGGAPAAMSAGADDVSEPGGAYKRDIWLKRAWDRLTGSG